MSPTAEMYLDSQSITIEFRKSEKKFLKEAERLDLVMGLLLSFSQTHINAQRLKIRSLGKEIFEQRTDCASLKLNIL